ncbi:unnamed protein product [Haemonchus placei]|uniref:CCHC-type domain-containing protein n=1 Tax=Haemonchus placei TaxID=6290 RepID=A0A158QKF3_HAEPC|nr:unnamed protein product [Haemonchus placei]
MYVCMSVTKFLSSFRSAWRDRVERGMGEPCLRSIKRTSAWRSHAHSGGGVYRNELLLRFHCRDNGARTRIYSHDIQCVVYKSVTETCLPFFRSKACFNCRQQGHVLADCPNRDDICFKCGSTEHSVHKCPRKHVQGFPFAKCFVCGCQGHLSRDCEKNAHGIYPDGGCCNMCGSKRHLKRDCPELAGQKQRKDERGLFARCHGTVLKLFHVRADFSPPEHSPK